MKKQMLNKGLLLMIPLLVVLLTTGTCFSSDNGVMDRIKQATEKKNHADEIDIAITVPLKKIKVSADYQDGHFFTKARKNEIKRFRCSSCHNNKEVMIRKASRIAHGDVKVIHGGIGKPLACYTCHSENDRDFLNTSKNNKIDMDHVYEMCGECHFRQKKDWIGGAHGKRVTYWAGERVVENCTSCHDPHSPRFKKRWPTTYSVPFK